MLSADALPADVRKASLQRFLDLPSGRERPGRYWRVDLDAIPIDRLTLDSSAGSVQVTSADPRVRVGNEPVEGFGSTGARTSKFGALTAAYANRFAFVTVPAGIDVEEPIVVTYRARANEAVFPYTVVRAEAGARATIVERVEAEPDAFVCGISELITAESSDVTFASWQDAAESANVFATRAARPGRDAMLRIDAADFGGALVVGETMVEIEEPGCDVRLASVFFPAGTQHVDLRSNVDHRVGGATSVTTVKSAAIGRGQARYVGNIRIAAGAQKSDASLRDDALLLSTTAHIDSIPALEIAANDVKAYHGATVGALDADMLFYMTTRGIERDDAERMVTIGFFEPVIDEFPSSLRDELRAAVERKVR